MKKHGGTVQEQIEYILRIRVAKDGDLDWDTMLDPDAMQMAYDMAGGTRGLAEQLDITIESCKMILQVHGIKLRRQGGAYKRTAAQMGLSTRADMIELGKSYGFSQQQVALLRAHTRPNVPHCPAFCPLALFCWDGQPAGGRRKRAKCGLADHLIAVGLAGGNHNGQ